MKKIFLKAALFLLFFAPALASGQIVPCGNPGQPACTIQDFFALLWNIFNFCLYWIAAPLAVLMIIVGGVLMMASAGNEKLFTLGKNTLYAAIIGIVLAFGAWLIIDFILKALGYAGNWSQL